ncbi:spore coat protein YsxE [Bacillus alkalicellulosilyticus]|uniref:spore coat protein YsxE n=1 Tax=Alkalihalobacterium alkalicellulosilyticum TaxID=1912214 RepID=UPI000998B274|nr:spore coat protein YsxE [Bacillus alkalicellulosilyticus]
MNTNELYHYQAILYHYDLNPTKIEAFGRIKKVYTDRGIFALKESRMNKEQADNFAYHIRKLARLNYRYTVPVIPSKYGELVLVTDASSYYLMPWMEKEPYSHRESPEQLMVEQMGIIHQLTVKTQSYTKETIEESYQALIQRWDSKRLELERFADVAEQKIYMSPYELTYMTHIHQMLLLIEEAKNHAKQWFDIVSEKEKYRTVFCHGNLSRSHVHFSKQGDPLLFNFEKAGLDTPARDLALFCRQSFRYSLWNEEEMVSWFQIYDNHLPLHEEEKHLLQGYLKFPEPVRFSLEKYVNKTPDQSELDHVRRLEKRIMTMRRVKRLDAFLFPPKSTEQGVSTQ